MGVVLDGVEAFDGQHCETTATGTLLGRLGIALSEPMLFGLGEGLGFIYWKMKGMDFPFIGGRIKPDLLTANLCRNLGLKLSVHETASQSKAWAEVKAILDTGAPVGLKLDCFHLEYFGNPIHFAGHYVAMYGYTEKEAFLVDTRPQGGRVKTSLDSLARARAEKGPMSSKNLYYTIARGRRDPDLKRAATAAIRANVRAYLNPPIANFGYKGIAKAAKEVPKWFQTTRHKKRDFCTTAMLMERAGTGGALFRNLYRDFLHEAAELLGSTRIEAAASEFGAIAKEWTEVACLFERGGETGKSMHIEKAAALMHALSGRELEALSTISST